MDCNRIASGCTDCPARLVCRCLQVTEDMLVDTITALELRTVKEVRRHTGAGEGCSCCHPEIGELLERHRVMRAACA
jgi:bacterioferritin-associated ferredoxin